MTELHDWIVHRHPDVAWLVLVAAIGFFITVGRKAQTMWLDRRRKRQEHSIVISQLGQVLAQLQPNGGTSLMDRIQSIQRELACMGAGLCTLYDGDSAGYFQCNERGEVQYLSAAFSRWTGFSNTELAGRNWIKLIPQADRDSIESHWYDSVRNGQDFSMCLRYQDTSGKPFAVQADAAPVKLGDKVIAYRGTIRRLEGDMKK